MKKLFFTAIALVAFSGVSMAETIDIKKVCIEKSQNLEEIIAQNDCAAIKFFYYNHLISQGATPSEASAGSYHIYFQCMSKELSSN